MGYDTNLINTLKLPAGRDGPSFAMRVVERIFFTARFARDTEFTEEICFLFC